MAKQLNSAGYGGMVSGVAPVVSDDEGEEIVDDDDDDEESEDGANGERYNEGARAEGGASAAPPLDSLIGTCRRTIFVGGKRGSGPIEPRGF